MTSLLQVGLTTLPGPSPSPAPSLFSSKLGETAVSLSPEQEAHKQQVRQLTSSYLGNSWEFGAVIGSIIYDNEQLIKF